MRGGGGVGSHGIRRVALVVLATWLAAAPVRARPNDGEARWRAFLAADDPGFARHPAAVYRGPPHALTFTGRHARFRSYRTRIQDDSRDQGVDFAGDRSLVVVGCGTGCASGYNVGLRDGTIEDLPPGRFADDFDLMHRPASRYLKLLHRRDRLCVGQAYVWSGGRLRPLGPELSRPVDGLYCPGFPGGDGT